MARYWSSPIRRVARIREEDAMLVARVHPVQKRGGTEVTTTDNRLRGVNTLEDNIQK